MPTSAAQQCIQELRERMQGLEGPGRTRQDDLLRTGMGLDTLLPKAAWERGTLTEWLGDGAGTLALAVGACLLKKTGVFVIIDEQRCFYPPTVAGWDVALQQTVVVQPQNPRETLWASEQALRSACGAVVLVWLDRLQDRAYRRLQLAAEAGGSLGMFMRPVESLQLPSWAERRFLVKPRPTSAQAPDRRWRVELVYSRGGRRGGALELEMSHETGALCLVSGMADPTTATHAARA